MRKLRSHACTPHLTNAHLTAPHPHLTHGHTHHLTCTHTSHMHAHVTSRTHIPHTSPHTRTHTSPHTRTHTSRSHARTPHTRTHASPDAHVVQLDDRQEDPVERQQRSSHRPRLETLDPPRRVQRAAPKHVRPDYRSAHTCVTIIAQRTRASRLSLREHVRPDYRSENMCTPETVNQNVLLLCAVLIFTPQTRGLLLSLHTRESTHTHAHTHTPLPLPLPSHTPGRFELLHERFRRRHVRASH